MGAITEDTTCDISQFGAIEMSTLPPLVCLFRSHDPGDRPPGILVPINTIHDHLEMTSTHSI